MTFMSVSIIMDPTCPWRKGIHRSNFLFLHLIRKRKKCYGTTYLSVTYYTIAVCLNRRHMLSSFAQTKRNCWHILKPKKFLCNISSGVWLLAKNVTFEKEKSLSLKKVYRIHFYCLKKINGKKPSVKLEMFVHICQRDDFHDAWERKMHSFLFRCTLCSFLTSFQTHFST